ncbi:hypothetical protein BCR37DRAFT_62573 [Protomyces lactucae-debilis]|uniref:Uncharacterized protein n=1 Tax=Protomyces lactucae-debilis TaxID=2754530 RepID=A0A1Y2FAT6_PROLT|nr:uncharacterized protein BCR37DRAFT_62573 [Protomyces lactucae-debilis]ORY81018.1 hypothetical protein BCR37DRAFT_62573 [Protomyces lactucae-debilis]
MSEATMGPAEDHPDLQATSVGRLSLDVEDVGTSALGTVTEIQEEEVASSSDVSIDESPAPGTEKFGDRTLTSPSATFGHRRRSSAVSRRSSTSGARRSSVLSSAHEFDDFQEGEDGSDFGDFEDEEQSPFVEERSVHSQASILAPLPDTSDQERLADFLEDTIHVLFPSSESTMAVKRSNTIATENEDEFEDESPFMLTDRAISLWKQLTAAPPLQPPAWKHSRVRRLFLVSLGIPLDLDEILPKMTHKKLVLPSTKKKDKNSSTRRRKIPPPPEFELHLARQLCQTTEAALDNMDDREKTIHIATLKAHTLAASNLLTYWLEQRELAQTDKETLEAVVENLVKFHKRQMDEQVKKQAATVKKTRFSFRSGS